MSSVWSGSGIDTGIVTIEVHVILRAMMGLSLDGPFSVLFSESSFVPFTDMYSGTSVPLLGYPMN